MKFAALLTFVATAYGLAFDGPLPTPVTDLVYAALTGFSPKPTNEARALPDLFRRQKAASNPEVCGYLDGDAEFPVSCTSASSCVFSSSVKWFGCCGGSSGCQVMTRCINSASVSSCLSDESCYNDPMAMACSASSAPNCVNMFAGAMSHWVCGASATRVAMLASAKSTGVSASSTADASKIVQGGVQPTASLGAVKGTPAAAAASSGNAAAASSVKSTGGGAMQTAGAVVGVAGGIVGAFAVFL